MVPATEILLDGLVLTEGPHWDAETQSLYYVDIFGKTIHKYVPATNQHTKANIGKQVSFIIPVEESSDRFIISMDCELAIITWDGISLEPSKIEKLVEFDNVPELKGNRINDSKTDPLGRLWAGSMGSDFELGNLNIRKGSLYSFGPNKQVKKHFSNIHVANGLAWSADLKKFYYIDSGDKRVDQFDYDAKNGTISNRQPLFTFAKHDIEGFPDGQTIDEEGNLWVAVFGGFKVLKIDSRKPETLLDTIDIPSKQVTSVAFGGPNLDELYVTSAGIRLQETEDLNLTKGRLYKVTGLGIKGMEGVRFKL